MKEVIKNRRSVRFFSDKPLCEEDLLELVEAGVYAPSGSNWQNQRFLVITDKEEIERIGRIRYVFPWKTKNYRKAREKRPAGLLGQAAALILVFADAMENDRRANGEYYVWEPLEIQNTSASIQNILLMATAKGIGTCWVSASDKMSFTRLFSGKSWRSLLAKYSIPSSFKLHGIICCGWPKECDELGYPRGESKHGATIWEDVERQPLSYYLIETQNRRFSVSEPSRWERLKVRIYAGIARRFQRIVHSLDLRIGAIETRPYRNGETKPKDR